MRILVVAVFALILFAFGLNWMEIAIVCLVSYVMYGVLIPAM